MSSKLNQNGMQELIDGDLAWLEQQPRTLEREHTALIVKDFMKKYHDGPQYDVSQMRARIAELERTVDDLRGKLAQFDQVSPEVRNCILGMSLEEATKQIPGGATINMEERFVMSLAWDCNGEAMHEHWGEGVTPATAVLKLYERAKRAEDALKGGE